jgi:GcrA cell cycle regulator
MLEDRTRNAVIGCVARLKLPEREKRRGKRVRRAEGASHDTNRDAKLRRTRAEIREARRLAKSRAWLPLPGTNPVTLVERTLHQCAWPVGETLFCGEPKSQRRPYCSAHCRLAYLPPQEVVL